PALLIKNGSELKTREEIETEANAEIKAALERARAELIHRFSRIEVVWTATGAAFFGLQKPFGAASGTLVGSARIHISQILGPEPLDNDTPILELTLFGAASAVVDLNGDGAKAVTCAVGAVVVLRRATLPSFRIDLDDFNLGLPEFELPELKLTTELTWPGSSIGATARAFERFLEKTGITVDIQPAGGTTPILLLTDLAGTPKWSIVDKDNFANRQKFTVTVKSGGTTIFTIQDLTAGYDGDLKISGTIAVTTPFTIPDDHLDLGPLQLTWKNVRVTPVLTLPVGGGSGPFIAAKVEFDSLLLSSREEPDVTLGLKGKVLFTPNGISDVELEVLVGVDVLKLAVLAQRLGSGILRLLSSCDDAQLPNILPKLLHALSRLAAAAARAIGFVGAVIGKLLVGIARAIGKLIETLAALMRAAGNNLVFEIRMTVDPLEVLQIVVTARGDGTRVDPVTAEALGLRLSIPASWQPAVLIDFVAQPGVYLLAVPDETANETIAELSTDLWLKQAENLSAVRDADSETGDRGKEPLIALKLKRKTDRFAVMVAGVRRGDPIFLQRIVDPPVLV
ncbi:MAG TPA: hypothetical protein VF608_14915, partial [Thermoanaerobaculia bacterium]